VRVLGVCGSNADRVSIPENLVKRTGRLRDIEVSGKHGVIDSVVSAFGRTRGSGSGVYPGGRDDPFCFDSDP
jgi:hypothetical protein